MTRRRAGKEIAPLCDIPSEPGIVTQRLAAAHDGDRTRREKLARKPFQRRAAIEITRIASARRAEQDVREVEQNKHQPQRTTETTTPKQEDEPAKAPGGT